jgi:hypothetical protein
MTAAATVAGIHAAVAAAAAGDLSLPFPAGAGLAVCCGVRAAPVVAGRCDRAGVTAQWAG